METDDDRAKISVSLPDALKAKLDNYAKEHQLTNSDVVQIALEQLFEADNPKPTPTPGPTPPPFEQPPFDLKTVREYVTCIAIHQEHMRQGMQIAMLPCPPMLPPPPWMYNTREPGSPWKDNEPSGPS